MRDEQSYFVTGPDLKRNGLSAKDWPLDREPFYLETGTPGVFCRGRCSPRIGEPLRLGRGRGSHGGYFCASIPCRSMSAVRKPAEWRGSKKQDFAEKNGGRESESSGSNLRH